MTARPLHTTDPRRAFNALLAGRRVRLDLPPGEAAGARALFAAQLPAWALALLDVRSSEALERAGCLALRTTRKGLLVGLYRSAEAGMEADPELPYTTVCETHGGLVSHATRKLAQASLSYPEEWCPDCQDEDAP